MPTFGSFETEREIYSDPIYTVYLGRKSGDPKSEYAIKVFSIQGSGLESETAADIESLLTDIERSRIQGIEVQEKGARASKNISPVLEKGRGEQGVWYVTRFYPRSVNKIINGRVALTRDALHHLMLSIARGARDLKRECGRSHGDIQPSNIQISRSERFTEAEVVLSDPLPGSESDARNFETSDLRAIGRILLQLVRQRAITNDDDFLLLPILTAPEWTRLFGKETEQWLSLCNQLLDPALSPDDFSLEQLVQRLEGMEKKGAISPKMLVGAAAGLVVCGLVGWWLLRPTAQRLEISSDPQGATILVNGTKQERATPLTVKLKKGIYVIEAESTGLGKQTNNWVVEGGGARKLAFKFAYGMVAIKSEPPGATIRSGGVDIGKTPGKGAAFVISNVPAGTEVTYELKLEEYASKTVGGVVTNGQTLVLSETLPLVRDVGTVEMDSTPSRAKVYLKDKLLSSATPELVQLEQGTYKLTAVYSDWPAKEMTIEVKRGATVPAKFYFENGTVSLNSDPSEATVWSGTNRLGPTPLNVRRPAGQSTFRFEHAGFESTNVTVTVVDKGTVSIKPALLTTNGVFELSSDPAVATIFDASGKEIGRTTAGNPVKVTAAPGSYVFSARAEGLSEVTANLTVAKREVKKHTFAFEYGTVLLESEPAGAAIASEGKVLGFTPMTLVQKPGTMVKYQISATDYLPMTNEVTLKSGERERRFLSKLAPEPVSVILVSDPPGAQFSYGGAALQAVSSGYLIPWGTNRVTAKFPLYPALGEVARTLGIKKGQAASNVFSFVYGTVVLTNLPDDVVVREGARELPALPGAHVAYDTPGDHTYDLYDGGQKVETLVTNVELGRVTVLSSKLVGEIRNSIGMRLVKVRNLLGPGKDAWVGKYEVTQGEYQKIMGTNPSKPPIGDNFPVEMVKWDQAIEFCQKLKASDELKPPARGDYRLPTLEQWKILARGTEFKDAVVRTAAPAVVGTKAANPQRLHDVLGNVWEWLADTDGTNCSFTGTGFNVGFSLDAAKVERKSRVLFDGPEVGFRVVLVPSAAATTAARLSE